MMLRGTELGEGAEAITWTGRRGVTHNESTALDPGLFKNLLDNLYDGVTFVDATRHIRYWNKGAERISGYAADEVVGRACHSDWLEDVDCSGCRMCQNGCPLRRTLLTGEVVSKRVHMRHKNGRSVAVEIHVMPIRDREGAVVGGVQIFRDASTTVALELAYSHLRELVEKDALTGAASRRHLDGLVAEQLAVSRRGGLTFSVIMADVDGFKQINDGLGHDAGDTALVAFAGMLQHHSRGTDVVGRYGGDEFLVVLPGTRLSDASDVAARMRQAARSAMSASGEDVGPTASFGVTEARADDTPQSLLRRADAALYAAKAGGRDRVECAASDVIALES